MNAKSVSASALDGTNPEAEQLADSLLQSLGQVAWAGTQVKKPTRKKPVATKRVRRDSKGRPMLPVAEEIRKQKELASKSRRKVVDELEEDTATRVKTYNDELSQELRKNMVQVREFFLQELNPLILASSLGSAQARDVVQRLLNVNVDLEPYAHFDSLMRKAIKIKMRQFVSKFTKVTQADLQALIEQQREVMLVNGQPTVRNGKPVSRHIPSTSTRRAGNGRPTGTGGGRS